MAVNAPVVIYDTSLNKQAYLPLAFDVAYELRANEVGRAWFSIPLDDPHIHEVTELRYAELFDGDSRVEMFRILKSWKGRDARSEYVRFECEHVLGTLMDDEFDDTFNAGSVSGTSQAITDILAEQGTGRWTKGTCAFSESYLYEWERGTSILKALLDVPKRFQEGYFWTFDTTSYPWTINLIAPPSSVTAYIDYGRNLKSIEREMDMTGLVTKLYPHGSGSGTDQVGITSEEPSSHEYITNNTGTYGTIVHHWTDQRYQTEAELYTAAVEKLAVLSVPKYTYKIAAADLYQLTQESIDDFDIGTLVTVNDEGLDIDVDVRVMGIRKGDVTGSPGEVQYELANKGEEFDLSEKLESNDLSGVSIANIPGGSVGSLPSTPTDAGLYISSSYLGYHNGSSWATYMGDDGRLYASDGTYYFDFNPVAGTLSIKISSIDISADSNVVDTAQIVDGAVTNAKIDSLSVSKLTAGTVDAQTITLAETTGSAIRQGKDSFADTDPGFWLGYAASSSLFSIGNATNYMKWTGTDLLVKGSITGDISADLNMSGHALYNCTDLRGGTGAATNTLNLDTNEWLGEDANTYLLLDKDAGSLRWAGDGTVYAGSGLTLQSGGDFTIQYDSGSYALELQTTLDSGSHTSVHGYLVCKDSGGTTCYIPVTT